MSLGARFWLVFVELEGYFFKGEKRPLISDLERDVMKRNAETGRPAWKGRRAEMGQVAVGSTRQLIYGSHEETRDWWDVTRGGSWQVCAARLWALPLVRGHVLTGGWMERNGTELPSYDPFPCLLPRKMNISTNKTQKEEHFNFTPKAKPSKNRKVVHSKSHLVGLIYFALFFFS